MKTYARPHVLASTLALGLAIALHPGGAAALCMASGQGCGGDSGGARFLKPDKVTRFPFEIGDRLPDDYQVLTNTRYYGLPPVRDGWQYFRVGHKLFRVDRETRKILDDATNEANQAF